MMKCRSRRAILCLLVLLSAPGCFHSFKPLPDGVSFAGPSRPALEPAFIADLTYVDPKGTRKVEQGIFDEMFSIIERAERFIVVDMFLYNDFQGEVREETRALSADLTEALISRKSAHPEMKVVVISDPVNTIYGGVTSKHFKALEEAGVQVVVTRLDKLRDSNPTYSTLWRILFKPFGNNQVSLLPSPFSEERVSLRSYLALLNFKANHRKVVIADEGDGHVALITSANPHDGSSAHGNVALTFRGAAVADLLETEKAVVAFSGGEFPDIVIPADVAADAATSVQVLTEGKIRKVLIDGITSAQKGDTIDVAVFYLSDRGVIKALTRAHRRGVAVRVLLDPNKDAFGYEKNGVPNRPVAAELHGDGVPVRWCDTHGEQCHAKMLLATYADSPSLLVLGSANFTRRNLQDFNLETSVAVRGPDSAHVIRDSHSYFDLVWLNDEGRQFSTEYKNYKDESAIKAWKYRVIERSGMGTF